MIILCCSVALKQTLMRQDFERSCTGIVLFGDDAVVARNINSLPQKLRVDTSPEKFENSALFLQLGLPSTIIRDENGAFRKRSSDRTELF